jgi:hypothetical protein
MKDKAATTDRRSFLKTGAIAAAPLAAATPVMAFADDGTHARLRRLEDERELEWLHRTFLRHVNSSADLSRFVIDEKALMLDDDLRSITPDGSGEVTLDLTDDGQRASSRRPVKVELESAFTGHTTLEKMARFQGQGSHRRSEERVLATDYVKGQDGWRIAGARFA